jgi:hypothetical protein
MMLRWIDFMRQLVCRISGGHIYHGSKGDTRECLFCQKREYEK